MACANTVRLSTAFDDKGYVEGNRGSAVGEWRSLMEDCGPVEWDLATTSLACERHIFSTVE